MLRVASSSSRRALGGARVLLRNSSSSSSSSSSSASAPFARAALTTAAVGAGAAATLSLLPSGSAAQAEFCWYNPLSWFGGSASSPLSSQAVDYAKLREDVEELVLEHSCGPLLVRLAWHASGTYDKDSNTGGSNGATMRYANEANDGANAGLDKARKLLEPLKEKYPAITYADLWTFAGKVSVEYMGGAETPWKPGRTDAASGDMCPPNGRLPDASQGAQHLRDIFYRMGFNDQEIVALAGAHTLGRCHTDRSGYDGPWSRDPNGFDNDYFRLLLEEKWTIRKNFKPTQYQDSTGELMMLPTDMALIWDPKFRPYVEKYAKDQDAWQADFAKAFGKLMENGVPR